MQASGLETTGVTIRFGAFTALDDVSIRIKPGAIYALLDENGARKSTLVKCVMGFYLATSGDILLDGKEARSALALAWSTSTSRWRPR